MINWFDGEKLIVSLDLTVQNEYVATITTRNELVLTNKHTLDSIKCYINDDDILCSNGDIMYRLSFINFNQYIMDLIR